MLCGRVSRDPKDELHVQALRDKFAVIPASVSWSGLKRLLKLYHSNATDPNDENIKPGRKTPRMVVEEYFKRERQQRTREKSTEESAHGRVVDADIRMEYIILIKLDDHVRAQFPNSAGFRSRVLEIDTVECEGLFDTTRFFSDGEAFIEECLEAAATDRTQFPVGQRQFEDVMVESTEAWEKQGEVAVQKTRTGCYAYVLVWKLLNKLGWQIYRHAQNVVMGADGRMNHT